MKGVLYILLAYLAGEILSTLMQGFMPASVLGMIVLFVALRLRIIRAQEVHRVSGTLLHNMLLFFVPVGVGLITSYDLITKHLWAIIISLLLSTVLVIVSVGYIQQKLGRKP